MDRKSKGNKGEEMAVKWLVNNGYEILERNYRYGRGEIDIIALWQNELLIFVEVKFRSRNDFGNPETHIETGQKHLIIQTAEEYIYAINWIKDIRFDVLAVNSKGVVVYLKDAFH